MKTEDQCSRWTGSKADTMETNELTVLRRHTDSETQTYREMGTLTYRQTVGHTDIQTDTTQTDITQTDIQTRNRQTDRQNI